MIYVLYGTDEVSIEKRLESIKSSAGPEDLIDVNITKFEPKPSNIDEIIAACDTVPFLSEKRVIIIFQLLSIFEREHDRVRGRTRQTKAPLEEWKGLTNHLGSLPKTTDLILVDGKINDQNPLLALVKPLAEIHKFTMPTGRSLNHWITDRMSVLGIKMERGAVDLLAEYVGSNSRLLDAELQKLATYRWKQPVTRVDVEDLVVYVREANIFGIVDAALEGRVDAALLPIHQMLNAGEESSYIITMIARQLRFIILAKSLRDDGMNPKEIGRRLSLSGYPLEKTMNQMNKLTHKSLLDMHQRLVEADLISKTSRVSDEVILDMLVARLATST